MLFPVKSTISTTINCRTIAGRVAPVYCPVNAPYNMGMKAGTLLGISRIAWSLSIPYMSTIQRARTLRPSSRGPCIDAIDIDYLP
jgi:hypothetical protein